MVEMEVAAILLGIIVIVLLYMGSRFLRDARAIRSELAAGRTLKELEEMATDAREELVTDYDEIATGLDKRIERLDRLNKSAEATIVRLEGVMNSERLKTLEERGILFAIESTEKSQGTEGDRNRRIAELLKGGATVEEVARITEASVREVELVRLLLRRREETEKA